MSREAKMEAALRWLFGKCGRANCRAVCGKVNKDYCRKCHRIATALTTPRPTPTNADERSE